MNTSKLKLPIGIIVACISLVIIAGIANGVMDTLQFHYGKSVFPQGPEETFLGGSHQFWHPDLSWRNKYQDGDPDKGPAFFLSTTALVFLTDGWHLFQFIMLSAFQLAIIIPFVHFLRLPWWIGLVGLIPAKVFFGIGFALMYSWVLIEQRENPDQTTIKQ
ncbi:hypothetical protein [Flavilitoribacter nigricans]|uniref:Uncharacterized protein n=1 Tax=Flavilitoribacter nigricans (strain ATCC 23147 / DSM 23189 / NBRC 102662 / NCIMB 1420 / SS-2) TaxID=1122177 RepID=A0A2D0MYX7_FLAN2|nr:hypothetical protein [Flavilitoribacter nigricans]PHN00663.1 hypothetical protein CRP01_41110 [Flavilitoribacter nigricans DSM 23189 = NBRC 102662]